MGAPFRGQHTPFAHWGPEGTLCRVAKAAARLVGRRAVSCFRSGRGLTGPGAPQRAAGQRRTRAAGALGGGPAAPSSPGAGRGTGVGASPGSCPEGFCGQSHAKSRKRRHTMARPPPLTRVTRSRLTARSGASSPARGSGAGGARERVARGAGRGLQTPGWRVRVAPTLSRDPQEKRPRLKPRNRSEAHRAPLFAP